MGRSPLDLDEMVEHWTVLEDELGLVAGKRGTTRLGFVLLLKFFTRHGRFPHGCSELPGDAVAFVAKQVQVEPSDLLSYNWTGRTIEYHRSQIRHHLGFRKCTVADAEKLTAWLAEHVAQKERRPERVREELLARCRAERIEPPAAGRIDRVVRSALHLGEETLVARLRSRLSVETADRIKALIVAGDPDEADTSAAGDETASGDDDPRLLAMIKEAPGNVSLETVLTEIDKLVAVRAIGLPAGLFGDVAPKVVAGWRARATVESPSHLRTNPDPMRLTLLAALVHEREREITDTLVELLIATVHRIGARAEKKVTKELVNAFRRVSGKENILFKVAEASLAAPEGTVRQVVFPAVSGGEQTLRELVHEFKTSGPLYRQTVQTTLKASYTSHYRRGLIRLAEVLEFRSSNTTHQPVIEALAFIRRHAGTANITYYPLGETIPTHRALEGDWEDVAYRHDTRGRRRTVRMVYEVATFQALRDQLRCKEIWVVGADKWRNPDHDLPADFAEHRVDHYATLRKPLDPAVFVDELRGEMRTELAALNEALPGLEWMSIAERGSGAIKLTPLQAQTEPQNLRRVKAEVWRRWGMVALVDMLKEAVLRTGCLRTVTSVATGGSIPADRRPLSVSLRERDEDGSGRAPASVPRTTPGTYLALGNDASAEGSSVARPSSRSDLQGNGFDLVDKQATPALSGIGGEHARGGLATALVGDEHGPVVLPTEGVGAHEALLGAVPTTTGRRWRRAASRVAHAIGSAAAVVMASSGRRRRGRTAQCVLARRTAVREGCHSRCGRVRAPDRHQGGRQGHAGRMP